LKEKEEEITDELRQEFVHLVGVVVSKELFACVPIDGQILEDTKLQIENKDQNQRIRERIRG